VTNGVVHRQQPKIETLRIRPYLSTVVISEAVQVKKPDPRIFARALAEVGCTASQAWFVGDHPVNDVLGAAAAGCRSIWLRGVHPWPPDHPVPSWQIGALPELVALVQQERSPAT
jgi:putative hydrolase of the HAD superfamily